ncbi:MAG: hypothetical protein JST65_14865 [Acidobacteria bacterium]|nr:hypothetical protein [Acidobacteriota bacterium]
MDEKQLQNALRHMPKRLPPARLTANLKVIASRERLRTLGEEVTWRDRLRMSFRELMRPIAVPACGGLASAIVIFSSLMPSLAMPIPAVQNDVRLALTTEPSVKYFMPIGISESELVVDLMVDGSGRMVDYSIVSGGAMLKDMHMRRQLENTLLFTEFTPATKFGGPAAGRVRLYISSSQINIRG